MLRRPQLPQTAQRLVLLVLALGWLAILPSLGAAEEQPSNQPGENAPADAAATATPATQAVADQSSAGTPGAAAPKAAGDSSSLVDPALRGYQRTSGVSGTIKAVGSDTMNNLMTLWAEGFKRSYPNVRAEIEGKGSSTAPPALIAGTSTFGPMSRDMKTSEIEAFETRHGYKPTVAPGGDRHAGRVRPSRQSDQSAIASSARRDVFVAAQRGGIARDPHLGRSGADRRMAESAHQLIWSQCGLRPYAYFKENSLFGGDYRDKVIELPGSSAVVQAIATDKYGIGYSGIGFATAGVRAVPLAVSDDAPAVLPRAQFALTGEYPLARFLWLAVNYKPGSRLDPLRQEFIRYVYSSGGPKRRRQRRLLPRYAADCHKIAGRRGDHRRLSCQQGRPLRPMVELPASQKTAAARIEHEHH